MTKIAKPLLVLAPLALLAACSSDEPAPPPADNAVEMLDVTNEAVGVPEAPVTMNAPAPVGDNVTAADEAPPVDDREQIESDAAATGMTARVNRDEEPATGPANETAPVSEEK